MEEKYIVSAWYNMVRKEHLWTYCEAQWIYNAYNMPFTVEAILPEESESNDGPNTH